MKAIAYSAITIIVMWAILALLQIWVGLLDAATFLKITGTAALVLVVLGITSFIYKEQAETKYMKENKYID